MAGPFDDLVPGAGGDPFADLLPGAAGTAGDEASRTAAVAADLERQALAPASERRPGAPALPRGAQQPPSGAWSPADLEQFGAEADTPSDYYGPAYGKPGEREDPAARARFDPRSVGVEPPHGYDARSPAPKPDVTNSMDELVGTFGPYPAPVAAAGLFGRGIAEGVASIPKGLGALIGDNPVGSTLSRVGQRLQQSAEDTFPVPKEQQSTLGGEVAKGVGGAAGMVAGAALTGGGSLVGGMAAGGAIAGTQGADAMATDAAAHGASPATQQTSAWEGLAVGTLSALPIANVLKPFGGLTGQTGSQLVRYLTGIAQQAGLQGGVGAAQQALNNEIARLNYDPQRGAADGTWHAFIVNGIVGGLFGALHLPEKPDPAGAAPAGDASTPPPGGAAGGPGTPPPAGGAGPGAGPDPFHAAPGSPSAPQGPDGRFATGAGGFVASDAGGPLTFPDQISAARWILRQGALSPDQIFEIANHPTAAGYTVRETGRAAPQGQDAPGFDPGSGVGPDVAGDAGQFSPQGVRPGASGRPGTLKDRVDSYDREREAGATHDEAYQTASGQAPPRRFAKGDQVVLPDGTQATIARVQRRPGAKGQEPEFGYHVRVPGKPGLSEWGGDDLRTPGDVADQRQAEEDARAEAELTESLKNVPVVDEDGNPVEVPPQATTAGAAGDNPEYSRQTGPINLDIPPTTPGATPVNPDTFPGERPGQPAAEAGKQTPGGVFQAEAQQGAPSPASGGTGGTTSPVTGEKAPEPTVRERIEAATQDINPEPTPAQAEAGNYSKAHVRVHGLDITLENAKGSERKGTAPDGKEWRVNLPAHYGYIRKSEAADGDHLDVYVGDHPDSPTAYVIDQVDPSTGRYDEAKAVLGVRNLDAAKALYRRGFSDNSGGRRLGAITPLPIERFKDWLKNGDTTRPLALPAPASRPEPEKADTAGHAPSGEVSRGETGGVAQVRNPGAVPEKPEPDTAAGSAAYDAARRYVAERQGPLTARALAGRLGLAEAGGRTLLDRLAAKGVVRKLGGRYVRPAGSSTQESVLLHVARHKGLDPSLRPEMDEAVDRFVPGAGKVFRKGGLKVDDLAQSLVEDGYLPPGATDDQAMAAIERDAAAMFRNDPHGRVYRFDEPNERSEAIKADPDRLRHGYEGEVAAHAEHEGHTLSEEELGWATDARLGGRSVEDAVEHALIRSGEEWHARNAPAAADRAAEIPFDEPAGQGEAHQAARQEQAPPARGEARGAPDRGQPAEAGGAEGGAEGLAARGVNLRGVGIRRPERKEPAPPPTFEWVRRPKTPFTDRYADLGDGLTGRLSKGAHDYFATIIGRAEDGFPKPLAESERLPNLTAGKRWVADWYAGKPVKFREERGVRAARLTAEQSRAAHTIPEPKAEPAHETESSAPTDEEARGRLYDLMRALSQRRAKGDGDLRARVDRAMTQAAEAYNGRKGIPEAASRLAEAADAVLASGDLPFAHPDRAFIVAALDAVREGLPEAETAPKEEPGAEGRPQLVIPGTERSAGQAMKAREGRGIKGRKAQAEPGGMFEKPGGEQADIEAAPEPASSPGSAAPKRFEQGDRVVLKDGRHGAVAEANHIRFQSVLGGGGDGHVSSVYRVRTDGGAERTAGNDDLEREAGERPPAPRDPVFEGAPVEPGRLRQRIASMRSAATKAEERAKGRRKPELAAQDREAAKRERGLAREAERVLGQWVGANPEQAKRELGLNDDHLKLYGLLGKKHLTGPEEKLVEVYRKRASASPDKFSPGMGVAWKVTGDQTNRGYRIVSVDPASRTARIRQVADTGLTATGGDRDRMADTQVPLGDLARERKYDAPAFALRVGDQPASRGPGSLELHPDVRAEPLTPKARAERAEIMRRLRNIAAEMNPHADLSFFEALFGRGAGMEAHGMPGDAWHEGLGVTMPGRRLIAVALSGDDPEVLGTGLHELWHSIEPMLRPEDVKLLRDAYPGGRGETAEEETAEAFGAWAADREGYDGPPEVGRLFGRIWRFLKRLGNMLRGMGFQTVEDLFGRARKGGYAPKGEGGEEAPSFAVRRPRSPSSWQVPDRAAIAARNERWTTALRRFLTTSRQRVQDEFTHLDAYQRAIVDEARGGKALPDRMNPKQRAEIWEQRATARTRRFEEEQVRPYLSVLTKAGIPLEDVGRYLVARHAPYYNAAKADQGAEHPEFAAGIDDATARERQREYEEGPQGDVFKDIARRHDAITDQRLRDLVSYGLVSQETADTLRAMYPHYVSLAGISEPDEIDDAIEAGARPKTGRGFDVRGPEFKVGRGRGAGNEVPYEDVLPRTLSASEGTYVRGEKNRVGQAVLALADRYPNPEVWEVGRVEPSTSIKDGQLRTRKVPKRAPPEVLAVKRDGTTFYLTIRHPDLAAALHNMGAGGVTGVLQATRIMHNWLATVNTRASPDFIVTNLVRDMQDQALNLQGTELQDRVGSIVADVPRALQGVALMLRGNTAHPWARWAREWEESGGRTGFVQIRTLDQQRARLQRLIDDATLPLGRKPRDAAEARRMAARAWRKGPGVIAHGIEFLNDVTEGATRLAVYKNAREAGLSRDRAAYYASNATVNFNKRGAFGRQLSAIWLFANASIQSNANIARAMSTRRGLALAAGVVGAGFVMGLLNALLAGTGEDGENNYDRNASGWIRQHNLLIPMPRGSSIAYLMFPLAYGWNSLWAAGETAGRFVASKAGAGNKLDMAAEIASLASMAFNTWSPIGGAVPTAMQPFWEMRGNQDFAGKPIVPDETMGQKKAGTPGSEVYWPNTPNAYVAASKGLSRGTGGNGVEPGSVEVPPNVLQHFVEFLGGGALQTLERGWLLGQKAWQGKTDDLGWRDVPAVRRFLGGENPWYTQTQYARARDAVAAAEARSKVYRKAGDDQGADRLQDSPEGRVRPDFKASQSRLADLYVQRRGAVRDGEDTRDLDARIADEKTTAVRAYNDAARGAAGP